MTETDTRAARPRVGDELELTIDRLAHGGAGVARLDGYVVFVRGAVPGRPRAGAGHQVQALVRRGGHGRAARAVRPSASSRAPRTPARPGRCCPTSASSREKEDQVRDALSASAASRRRRSSRSCPRSSSCATATSSSTRSARTSDGELVLGFHRPGRLDLIDDVTHGHPRLRARRRAARGGQGLVPRARASRPGTGATSTGLLRNLVVREGRRTGQLQARARHEPGGELPRRRARGRHARRQLPLDPRRGRRGDHPRGRDRGREGQRRPRGGAVRPALPHLARRVLPDQHRDGRAPLRARRSSWPG